MEYKVIQTKYNGYHFRSRTEARWAVFFDSLGERYEYEKEGFALPSGCYLPDFWLPGFKNGMWMEIKGKRPNEKEYQLGKELHLATSSPVLIAWNAPHDYEMQLFDTEFDCKWKNAYFGRNKSKCCNTIWSTDNFQELIDNPNYSRLPDYAFNRAKAERFDGSVNPSVIPVSYYKGKQRPRLKINPDEDVAS